MDYFTEIPDAMAITVQNGVYRQVKMYRRADKVYARHGAGFVRILQGGTTTCPNVRCIDFDGAAANLVEGGGYLNITNLKVVAAQ